MSFNPLFRPHTLGPTKFRAFDTSSSYLEIAPADGVHYILARDGTSALPVSFKSSASFLDALGVRTIYLDAESGEIIAVTLTAPTATFTTSLAVTGPITAVDADFTGDVEIGTAGDPKTLTVHNDIVTKDLGLTGDLDMDGNLTVIGDLSVTGDTFVTDVYLSEVLSITNTGTGPAATIRQDGAQDILVLMDDAVEVFRAADGGVFTMTGTLGVSGAVAAASTLDVTGLSSLDGGIDVNASAFTVSTAGAISTASSLGVTGSATLAGITVIGGHTSMAKSLTVGTQRNTTARDLRCVQINTDTAILAGGHDEHTGAMLYTHMTGGWSTADLRVRISSSYTTYNAADAIIIAYAKTTVRDALDVGGISTLTGLLNADGGIAVDTSDFTVSAAGAISTLSTLDVTGLSSLDGGIDVNAKCTIASATGDIATDGDLSVAGDLQVSGTISGNTFPTSIVRYDATATISIPAGCNGLIVEMTGGGGGGGGYGTNWDSGGGGGGAGYIKIFLTKNMISDLSLSAIYFVCGDRGTGYLGWFDGQNGGNSACYENDVDGDLIGQANGGYGGLRGNNTAQGGNSGYGSVQPAYDDICEIKYGENGESGFQSASNADNKIGGGGGWSFFGRGGRGGSMLAHAQNGVIGGGGGGAFSSLPLTDTAGYGGNGRMQITFY